MKGRFREQPLRRQIVVATQLFTLFISLGMCLILYTVSERYVRSTTLRSTEFNLQLVATTIQQRLTNAEGSLNWSVSANSIRRYLTDQPLDGTQFTSAYEAAYRNYISNQSQPYILRYFITDRANRFLQFGTAVSTSRALNSTSLQQFPYIGETSERGWSLLERDPLAAATDICLVKYRPILWGPNHEFIGCTYISLSPSIITDCLSEYEPSNGGELYLGISGTWWSIDSNGLHPLSDKFSLSDVTRRYNLEASSQLFWMNHAGESCLLLSCPIQDSGLYLAQSMPERSFWAQRHVFIILIFVTLFTIQLMGFFFARWLDHRISRPVVQLQTRIKAVGQGDFSHDDSIEWDNEFGDIGRGINELSHDVDVLMTRRLSEQKERQTIEYRMLQNEINPHFIYNTLNTIRWMSTIQHATGITELVTAFSRLLKSVSKSNETLVPLCDELALLNDYFTIQQYRYGGDIYIDVRTIEDESLVRSCLIPRFTLQPLAENAIFHGLEPNGGTGNILLDIVTDGEDVLIRMQDDGVGMNEYQAAHALDEPTGAQAAEKFRHVGLWNVHRRLQVMFGERYGLTLQSSPGQGTMVIIRIPRQKGSGKT
ncbi:MAG: sensor histidine kinase [Subdoligranulum variabile]|nr:sensor histidine kinase [Subdoligranulum variabile]